MMMMVRLPKVALVLSLFALLASAAPVPAQIGEAFSSADGAMVFTDSSYGQARGIRHMSFTASGTEVAAGHAAYTDGGGGSFDLEEGGYVLRHGTVTLVFSEADTLTISFGALLDPCDSTYSYQPAGARA
jgi:hypothetical protein